jgi:predicted Zn-dependent protease
MDILQIAPDHPFANYIMGSIALSHGEFESAEAYLQRSVESDPSVIATGDLAYVKFKLDDVNRAFELVTQALDRSKDLYEVWDTYGQILLEQGKLQESELALRTALKLNVQNPIVHLHLARVLFAQGRTQDSRDILEGIQPFESSLYGEEKRYYDALWLDVFGTDNMKAKTN